MEVTTEQRNLSQWKLFIQKNLNNVAQDLLGLDKDKSYRVDSKEFVKIIERRVQLPDYLKQKRQYLDRIVEEYAAGEGQVSYKEFVEDLRTFDYDKATN